MVKCNFNECARNTYNSEEKCILHFEKKEFAYDNDFYTDFYQELCTYIEQLALEVLTAEKTSGNYAIDNFSISQALRSNSINNEQKQNITEKFLNDLTISIEGIDFPSINTKFTTNNYCRILEKIGSIHFKNCKFWFCDKVFTGREEISYEECEFKTTWKIESYSSSSAITPVIYKNCVFKENVSFESRSQYIDVFHKPLFADCNFNKCLNIERIEYTDRLFNNSMSKQTRIKQFNIVGCKFIKKFILNNCEIDKFVIKDTEFESKFEFKNNKIQNNFEINNTNYAKLVDTYETEYLGGFEIKKSIFNEFTGFEKCQFGKKDSGNAALFLYATFNSFVNFRNTVFHSGLNIENINLKESPNFLNTVINPKNSNRETFRIIKNSFDETRNVIEGNKYFAEEMKKYREEIKKTGKWDEKIILWFNSVFSNFGQRGV